MIIKNQFVEILSWTHSVALYAHLFIFIFFNGADYEIIIIIFIFFLPVYNNIALRNNWRERSGRRHSGRHEKTIKLFIVFALI